MKSELSEEALRFLEEKIPELAEGAFKQAYFQALASGDSVLEYDDGAIYEVFPDGNRKLVKKLKPRTKVTPGTKILIK